MSQIQKEMAARLAKLPPDLPLDEDEDEEAADGLGALGQRNASSTRKSTAQYTPLSGQEYFSEALEVETDADCFFRVYYTPPAHSGTENTIFVFHQGAGYTGLSFACLARQLTRLSRGKLGVLSFDARAHGKTRIEDGSEYDMSLDTLTNDLTSILDKMFSGQSIKTKFILAGHSMGGSVCANAVAPVTERVQNASVIGLCVLDAVEGTAMDALPAMAGIVKSNPDSFATLSDAIAWHVNNKVIRNPESARVSVPSMVVERNGRWVWRTDLLRSEPYWSDWFNGLSTKFISAKAAKLLVLAGADKLDTPLMIAQMQGKFQLSVVQNVGHCLQEDDPARVADILYAFYDRYFGQAVDLSKIKKVGEV